MIIVVFRMHESAARFPTVADHLCQTCYRPADMNTRVDVQVPNRLRQTCYRLADMNTRVDVYPRDVADANKLLSLIHI